MDLKKVAIKLVDKVPFLLYLTDVVSLMAHPVEQFSLWTDYFKTRQDAAFLRTFELKHSPDKIALLVLASDMVYEIKIQAMLATGLKLQGWKVVILLSRRYVWAHRYMKAFGIGDFVHWEDVKLNSKEKENCNNDAKAFLSVPMTFQSVKKWIYKGALIGPQVISSVSRKLMIGAPDVKDPIVQKNLRELLPETLEAVHLAGHLLDKVKPNLVSLIEANYALMGALVDTAISRKISVTQTVQPARDDAMMFKKLNKETCRIHPASVAKSSLDFVAKMPWTEKQEKDLWQEFGKRYGGAWFLQSRNQPGVKEKTRDEIIQQLQLDPAKKNAVVFSPVLWDANLFYGEDLFEDFGDWFIQTVRAACANPNVNWIIKLHPANAWKRARENVVSELAEITLIRKHIGVLPSYVKLLFPDTDISTFSLFKFADYGLTVRGTIGMELPCLGVPVFTAGTGRFSGLGFTVDSKSKEEYLERLSKIQEYPRLSEEQTLLAKQHAYCAFKLRPWIMKSFKAQFNYKKKGVHPLDNNLFFTVSSIDEITANGDLAKWAAWAGDENKVDYLDTDAETNSA
ncbi:hypothetical protein HZA42_02030 [Candidatus Peregrinibacteria bacterium]|nr:hypothetical protein [Candidatus Peregrinibacteria bacterium]